jgi:hypothetical protein
MTRQRLQQNLINHVGFVFDGSGSMHGRERDLVLVADNLIDFLKKQSVDRNQETRATMYIFGSDVEVTCYDIDVLRTPSITSFYNSNFGMTALRDATAQAINDMKQTATLYGDHAFLLYVLTDGFENASRRNTNKDVSGLISSLPNNWTLAGLVPDSSSKILMTSMGFPQDNVMFWDATTSEGVQEVGRAIQQATDNYYVARSQGIRSVTNLFNLNTQFLEPQTISTTLTKVDPSRVRSFVVNNPKEVIRDAVSSRFGSYRLGSTYYQLTKAETVQPQKSIIIRDKTTGELYSGVSARQLLGLPNNHTRVAPASHPNYEIFVQSTSPNRNLVGGTTALVL